MHKRLTVSSNFCQQWRQKETCKWGLLPFHLGSMELACFLHGVSTWAHPLSFCITLLISSSLQIAPPHIPCLQGHQVEQDPQFPSLLPHTPAILCPPRAEPSSQHTAAHHPHGGTPWAPRSPFQTHPFFPFLLKGCCGRVLFSLHPVTSNFATRSSG